MADIEFAEWEDFGDNGEHYAGQIGSEATPQEFLESLWTCMREWWRVLKPQGSVFVNLGDKRAGSGGHNNSGISHNGTGATTLSGGKVKLRQLAEAGGHVATRRNAPDRYNQAAFGRPKSKMLIPHRFAIGCEDGLADPQGIGWVMRQDLIWQKLNGLPESVTDRHRDSHEYIFHFTKQERYFAAMDEIREAHIAPNRSRGESLGYRNGLTGQTPHGFTSAHNPLGKLPGSVWPMASEALLIPQWAKEKYALGDHFAAFPTELPRRLILGFSPAGICAECGEGRRPVVSKSASGVPRTDHGMGPRHTDAAGEMDAANRIAATRSEWATGVETTITGYACACPTPDAPTTPSLVLDPFGGTGTVALVAKGLGRIGISVDLSSDYCNLARWRIEESGHGKKAEQRTWWERQGSLT